MYISKHEEIGLFHKNSPIFRLKTGENFFKKT